MKARAKRAKKVTGLSANEILLIAGILIARIDSEIIELLLRRSKICRSVGMVKTSAGIPIYRPKIEKGRIADAEKYAKKIGLDPKLANAVFSLIITHSRETQIAEFKKPNARKTKK